MDASTSAHGGVILLSDQIESDNDYLYQRQLEMSDGMRTWELHDLGVPKGGEEVYLVFGNTGVHAPTADQVAKVAKAIQDEPERMKEIETIGLIARRGIEALKNGDYEAVGRAIPACRHARPQCHRARPRPLVRARSFLFVRVVRARRRRRGAIRYPRAVAS